MRYLRIFIGVVIIGLLTSGCATYKVTKELEAPIQHSACKVSELTDVLPTSMDDEDRPTPAEIGHLETSIEQELTATGLFSAVGRYEDSSLYILNGTILAFRRGSGAVRFLIGFGLGDAKITVDLKLVERPSGSVIFAGNFSQTIGDWTEKGEKMYDKIARDFAKAIASRVKKLGTAQAKP